jgi:hypothetical protein
MLPDTTKIRVKFLSKAQAPDKNFDQWLRRFPGRQPRWGPCEFTFDPDCRDYDWLVVYDDLPRQAAGSKSWWEEDLACAPQRTLLMTTEPSAIKTYGRGFCAQFGWVLTSQEPWALRHPRRIYRQVGLIWFYGLAGERGTYDHLQQAPPPVKTKTIATVCSAKQMRHTLHHARFAFTNALQQRLPEMEVFGLGVRPIPDKADALDPYQYHVAIENHTALHHWTEKLADPFLGYCLPFYHGCPNAAEYFPEESFIPINILQPAAARERIEKAIRDQEYQKRLPAIIEARRRVLADYSTFAQLSRLIAERHAATSPAPPVSRCLLSRHTWRRRHYFRYLEDVLTKGAVQGWFLLKSLRPRT